MFRIETLVYRVCHSITFCLTFMVLAPGVIRKTTAACCFVLGGLRQQPQVKSGQGLVHMTFGRYFGQNGIDMLYIYIYIYYTILYVSVIDIYIYELTCSRERGGTVWHNGCPLVLACALAWRATYMT